MAEKAVWGPTVQLHTRPERHVPNLVKLRHRSGSKNLAEGGWIGLSNSQGLEKGLFDVGLEGGRRGFEG